MRKPGEIPDEGQPATAGETVPYTPTNMGRTVKVPDVEGPTMPLCYKSSELMTRCDRVKDHRGMHSWELERAYAAITTLRDYFKQHLEVFDKL